LMPAASRPGGRSGRARSGRPAVTGEHGPTVIPPTIKNRALTRDFDTRLRTRGGRCEATRSDKEPDDTCRYHARCHPGPPVATPYKPRPVPWPARGPVTRRSGRGASTSSPPQSTWGGREWEGDATFSGIARSNGSCPRTGPGRPHESSAGGR
jgi:hypothetical protein